MRHDRPQPYRASVPLLLLVPWVLAFEARSAEPPPVVASVGDEPIDAGEVARAVQRIHRGKEVSPAAKPVFEALAVEDVVQRRLVLAYARRTGAMPDAATIDASVAQWESRGKAQGASSEQPLGEADLRRQIAWNLVWAKYLAKYATSERMQAYFEAHRSELDGTQMLVSHVLFSTSGKDAAGVEEVVKQARAVREQIEAGTISFAAAAKKHSAGPSAQDGGRLGWITRRGPMDESFSRAAFALQPGQVSPPVRTPFGVHLIRCEEVKPGTRQLTDVRGEVEEALGRELLERLARAQQEHTPVRFTGKAAYFKPGTREVVPANPETPAKTTEPR